jgi:hypothetical protein
MAVKTAVKTAEKTAEKTATETSPEQTTLTAEWTLSDAQKEINGAFRAGEMKTYLQKKEKLVKLLGERQRLIRAMYKEGLSIEKIIEYIGANALADLAIILVLDPLFEIDHYLSS